MNTRIVLSMLVVVVWVPLAAGGGFYEGWESAAAEVYTPTCGDCVPTFIRGDAGNWYVGDTVSEWEDECGPTPQKAEILTYSKSQALRLVSTETQCGCSDNVWAALGSRDPNDPGLAIPLTAGTTISFQESGELIDPELKGWGKDCLVPPCFDNVSLLLADGRGNVLAYVLQRYPDAVANEPNSNYEGTYREIFLDPNAGRYTRNLYDDFLQIREFDPNGATVASITFQVDEHGWGVLDDLSITNGPAGPQASFTCSPDKPMIGGLVSFDAATSSDPDGSIVLYEWDWGDGETSVSMDPNATHAYAGKPDVYTVALTVTDGDGLTHTVSKELDLRLENGDIFLARGDTSQVPGFWTRAGIYSKALNRVVEARPEGVGDYSLDEWGWPDATCVRVIRVSADEAVRDEAVAFAIDQKKKEYDWFAAFGKQSGGDGPFAGKWYSSELVWAAYLQASQGEIDLDPSRSLMSVVPSDIEQSPLTSTVGEHMESVPATICTEMFGGHAAGYVDFIVVDPNGRTLSLKASEIPGGIYEQGDLDGDGKPDDVFRIPEPMGGPYLVQVVAEPNTPEKETYAAELMFGRHIRALASDAAIADMPLEPYAVELPLPLAPVHRFWSPVHGRHFYTINESEALDLIENEPNTWAYEGAVYRVFADGNEPDSLPVYRFWSPVANAYFYTISEAERDFVSRELSDAWGFDGIAFYAFAEGSQPPQACAVHRFWSTTSGCHFYTINEEERDVVIRDYSHAWIYEGIAWYAYPPEASVCP